VRTGWREENAPDQKIGSGKFDGPASAAGVLTRDQMICLFPSPLQKAGERRAWRRYSVSAKQQCIRDEHAYGSPRQQCVRFGRQMVARR
jgi:hypothetical protein